MNEVIEYKQTISKKGKTLDLAINKILGLVNIAAGNIPGILNFITKFDDQIKLVCNTNDSYSTFKKIGISKEGNKLLGILLIGNNEKIDTGFWVFKYSSYNVKLHYWFFCFEIDTDSSNIDQLKQEFENNFKSSIDNLHDIFLKKRRPRGLCMS
jgi:hypothetical protein